MSGLERHHLVSAEKHKRGSAMPLCNGLLLAQVINSLSMYSMKASITLGKETKCLGRENRISRQSIISYVTSVSSFKTSSSTKNVLFLLSGYVIKALLHRHEDAQRGKELWGNPTNTLTWLLPGPYLESSAHQGLMPTCMKEQRGTVAGGDTPKRTIRKRSPHPGAVTGKHQPYGPALILINVCQWKRLSGSPHRLEVQRVLQKQGKSFFGLHKFTIERLMEETKAEKGRGQGGLGGE